MRTEGKARSGKDLGFCLREAGATGACVGEGQHRTDLAVRVLPLAMCEGRAEPCGLWQNPRRRGRLAGREQRRCRVLSITRVEPLGLVGLDVGGRKREDLSNQKAVGHP